jgi:hypothetical protein
VFLRLDDVITLCGSLSWLERQMIKRPGPQFQDRARDA